MIYEAGPRGACVEEKEGGPAIGAGKLFTVVTSGAIGATAPDSFLCVYAPAFVLSFSKEEPRLPKIPDLSIER